ncbi:MAG: hypothetical protein ACRESR_02275 [Gammaproteobacteria bacterium]
MTALRDDAGKINYTKDARFLLGNLRPAVAASAGTNQFAYHAAVKRLLPQFKRAIESAPATPILTAPVTTEFNKSYDFTTRSFTVRGTPAAAYGEKYTEIAHATCPSRGSSTATVNLLVANKEAEAWRKLPLKMSPDAAQKFLAERERKDILGDPMLDKYVYVVWKVRVKSLLGMKNKPVFGETDFYFVGNILSARIYEDRSYHHLLATLATPPATGRGPDHVETPPDSLSERSTKGE